MNTRRRDILRKLDELDSWIKGKDLSKRVGVTDRTIRSDIEEINRAYPGLIESSTRDGYRLNTALYSKVNFESSTLPQTPEERTMYIIKRLLFHKNNITFLELQDALYVSEHTIESDIKRVRKILSPYTGMRLVREKNRIYFEGNEQIKRRLYRDLLSNEIHGNFLNLNRIAALYEKFDLLRIMEILEDSLSAHDYKLRETSIPMIIIHIGITIERMLNGNYLEPVDGGSDHGEVEMQIAEHFLTQVISIVPIQYREEEVIAIARLLSGYKNAQLPDTHMLLGERNVSIGNLIKDISNHLNSVFDLDFSADSDFQSGLHLHLQSLLGRLQKNVSIPNAHLNEIKVKYPLVFEMGLHVSRIIETTVGCEISESEAGFVALHIGAAYDRLTMKYKHKVLLISPNNQSFAKLTEGKIRNVFGERLEIVSIQTYFVEREVAQQNVDLIITLSPLEHALSIPTVQISMFVNQEDESNIFVTLNELDKRRFNLAFGRHFGKLVDERFFYTDLDFETPEAVIRFMSQDLVKEGYVPDSFTKSVLDREKMSSTSFDYALAIPHPLKMESKQSIISIGILDKPIMWGTFQVKLVILLAITESDSATMWLFFDWLSETITNANKMTNLIESRKRDEFVYWMIND
ncbi:transcription antiterminator [Erysipelothrix sp. HDW6C]|uniref:BglG family transcription antiterminator n=1 Tax=Erysipelothrix sp. HDW6C TaxID=2714930 RepID=UPI001408E951|nr:BglG family transcription antiterminator [Erysipelothrix sp. HDW6C]QIK68955.1 transcription antiterminator [Erysipelothrix sp. HDW6C]